ncbi:hypothetical protein WJX81_006114 [Elliptochloris bilobata]|uniref:Coiled-coil domain-containing protein n=1 Tax=Elliptochloris bilobata TaxID=381761 RepID=A0AAW1S8Q3_9CHLO
MPKKLSTNPKAEAARGRKEESKQKASADKQKAASDQEWAEAGDGSKSKGALKKEADEKKRQELAAKKAEAKKLLEAEEASLASAGKKKTPAKPAGAKVTTHQLLKDREKAAVAAADEAKAAQLAKRREVSEASYGALVEGANPNREEGVAEARSVDAAISVLSLGPDTPEDRNPEKRLKAAFAAFSDSMLPELKLEKPGLKQSQYKEMLWKLWQKSPSNPLNGPPSAS